MEPLELEKLIELVARHVPADPKSIRIHRCPTGKFNTTYFIERGPRPLVLRIAPPDDRSRYLFYEYRMMRQEPGLHALIRSSTSVPIPEILACDTSHAITDRDYLLMERGKGSGTVST